MSRTHSGRSQPRRTRTLAACILGGLSVASVASAAATYSVTSLTLDNRPLYPVSISSAGHIAGVLDSTPQDASFNYHAFVRSPTGTVVEIPTLAGGGAADGEVMAFANGVNANGDVVGVSQIAFRGAPHAFLYQNGQLIDLSPYLDDTDAQAYGINNNGVIVGTYQNPNFGNAFVLRPTPTGYTLIDLGPGVAHSVSESGYVVGESLDANHRSVPFVFRDANNNGVVDAGEYSQLGTLGGISGNIAVDVNDAGTIVGQSRDAGDVGHAVMWTSTAPGAAPKDLGNFGVYDAFATSINNAGQVVGGASSYAFLYQNNQLKQLDSFIPTVPRSTFPSWQLYFASSINNAGEIIGQGRENDTGSGSLSDQAGFLLKSSGSQPPPPTDVKLASFTANPGTITLRSQPVSVTFTLGLTAKTKAAIKVPLVIKLNGETVLGFPVNIGKNKSSSTSVLQFDQEWTPGTYSVTASYGGVDKTATLVVNPAAPVTLKSLTFPAKVKRGKKVNAALSLTDVPTGVAEVTLSLLDANQNPIVLFGIPIQYVVKLDKKDSITAKVSIPKELPAGVYYVSASYGGVTKSVQFQAQ